jgi:hypothetical protein
MWGGYSPKVYDGDFVELFAEWFEENLSSAGVISDQHFEWGKNALSECINHKFCNLNDEGLSSTEKSIQESMCDLPPN